MRTGAFLGLMLCGFGALGLAGGGAANAQDANAPKTITIAVAAPPGGILDPYARVLARFLGAHLPEKPNVIISNVPGAGGFVLARQLYTTSPKDGSMIGAMFPAVAIEPLIGRSEARGYDSSKFTWLGSTHAETYVCIVHRDSDIRVPADLLKREVIVGTTQPGSPTHDTPKLLTQILGVRFKLVTGYAGGQALLLALERREIDGVCLSWTTLKTNVPTTLEGGGYARIIAMVDSEGSPELTKAGIPSMATLAKSDDDRAALDLFFGPNAFGGPFILPPGVPAARVAALQAAFNAVIADPEAIAEAKRLNLDWTPLPGAEVQKKVEQLNATRPEVVKRVREALGTP